VNSQKVRLLQTRRQQLPNCWPTKRRRPYVQQRWKIHRRSHVFVATQLVSYAVHGDDGVCRRSRVKQVQKQLPKDNIMIFNYENYRSNVRSRMSFRIYTVADQNRNGGFVNRQLKMIVFGKRTWQNNIRRLWRRSLKTIFCWSVCWSICRRRQSGKEVSSVQVEQRLRRRFLWSCKWLNV
jgi:hypothetical protein